jgi:hypothetical protein
MGGGRGVQADGRGGGQVEALGPAVFGPDETEPAAAAPTGDGTAVILDGDDGPVPW